VEANTTDELRDEMTAALTRCWTKLAASIDARMPRSLRSFISGDDIVSETWDEANRIMCTRPGTRPRNYEGWLFTLAVGKLHDAVRSARRLKRGGGRTVTPIEQVEELLAADAIAVWRRAAEDARLADAIERGLRKLNDPARTAFLLWLSGLSERQIAHKLDESAASVDRQLHRAHEVLRQALIRASAG